ncbi:MAG: hypothetical protein PHO18_00685 [Synergistaceae bacterium]|nr:hypothetical protein [Synergistaceae bacterium]
MFFSFLLTLISGISLLFLVLTLSLLLLGAEKVLYDSQGTDVSLLSPYRRFLNGRCTDKCPPPLLYMSCISLLMIFLFMPMGSLPQFVETKGDLIVIIFLLLSAQGFYIRGMKNFFGEIYQSFKPQELFVLSRLAVTLIAVGGTLSWYSLNRGMPGNIFSLETFAATSLWTVAGALGKIGVGMFLVLLAVISPSKGVIKARVVDNVQIPEIFDAIRTAVVPAMIVSIFWPMRLGISMGYIGFKMYLIDFVFFWIRVMLVQVLFIPLINRWFSKLGRNSRRKLEYIPEIMLGAAGILLLMLDLYI